MTINPSLSSKLADYRHNSAISTGGVLGTNLLQHRNRPLPPTQGNPVPAGALSIPWSLSQTLGRIAALRVQA